MYYDRIRKDAKDADMPVWLKKARKGAEGEEVRSGGSLLVDMSLWFMLSCSFAACFGVVDHRDVSHSHAIEEPSLHASAHNGALRACR